MNARGDAKGIRWEELGELLKELETLQADKVLALARRLIPGLTAEDIRNPHDFPNLADPDWHFEDGILTGVQSVLSAVRSLQREHEEREEKERS